MWDLLKNFQKNVVYFSQIAISELNFIFMRILLKGSIVGLIDLQDPLMIVLGNAG